MSHGYIQQVEIQPAIDGQEVVVFFAIASETVNPFGGSAVNTHRVALAADEVTEEVKAAAKVLFDACAAAADSKLPVINGVKATLEVANFDDTVADLLAKRQPKAE